MPPEGAERHRPTPTIASAWALPPHWNPGLVLGLPGFQVTQDAPMEPGSVHGGTCDWQQLSRETQATRWRLAGSTPPISVLGGDSTVIFYKNLNKIIYIHTHTHTHDLEISN